MASFRRRLCFGIGFFFLLGMPLCVYGVFSAQKQKLVFVDEPLLPYTKGTIGGTAESGLNFELLSELFRRLDIDFEIRLMPWARALKTVEHGRADGIPLLLKTDERKSFLHYSDPIIIDHDYIIFSANKHPDFQWKTLEDLKPYRIGLVQGYSFSIPGFDNPEQSGFTIERAVDSDLNLKKLAAGRLDLAIDGGIIVHSFLRRHPELKEHIGIAEKTASEYTWHMGISKASPAVKLMPHINDVIAELKSEGVLDRIYLNAE